MGTAGSLGHACVHESCTWVLASTSAGAAWGQRRRTEMEQQSNARIQNDLIESMEDWRRFQIPQISFALLFYHWFISIMIEDFKSTIICYKLDAFLHCTDCTCLNYLTKTGGLLRLLNAFQYCIVK